MNAPPAQSPAPENRGAVSSQPGFGPTFFSVFLSSCRRSLPEQRLTFTTFWGKDKLIQAPQAARHQGSNDQDQGKHVRHANSLGLFAVFTNMQNGEERFLRQLDVTDLLHTLLTFCFCSSFFLRLTSPPAAFRQDVFTQLFHGRAR
jgi:hypothetical protein